MELRHLRYFTAVAAHGGFSRAAQTLHLTQPALSRQIRDLEEELGVQLLRRGKNAVALTEAGEIFYDEARDLLARADQAVQRLRGRAAGGTLRVGYAPSLMAGVLPRALEKFCSRTPRVRVELADLSTVEMFTQIGQGRLDLVLTAPASLEDAGGLRWTEVRRLPLVAVFPRTHPLARLRRVPPARLRDLPLTGFSRQDYPEYWAHLRAALRPFGVVPRAETTADGISSLFAALEAGTGVAVLPASATGLLPPAFAFAPFFPALAPVVVAAGVPAVQAHPQAELFIRCLRDEARAPEAAAPRRQPK